VPLYTTGWNRANSQGVENFYPGPTKDVLVDLADAEQESGVESDAGKAEVVVLRHQHAVQVDRSRGGFSGVICRDDSIGSIAICCCLAGCDVDRVGEVRRDAVPCMCRPTPRG
jgi:hypothetical protein